MPALAAALLDLVLPRRCVGCGTADARAAPGAALCRRCLGDCTAPHVTWHGSLAVCAATAYAGPVRQALLAYKERGRRDLAGTLGGLLAGAIAELVGHASTERASPRDLLLVSVPSRRAAAAARGGDHVARLARTAATGCGVPVAPGVLGYVRAVRDSAGLGVAERAGNLAGAMGARPGIGASAVLVDDIVTTGATLLEAERAMRTGGWPVLGAAVVAATPRRSGPARPSDHHPAGLTLAPSGERSSVRTT